MKQMFYAANVFNQDLCSWNMRKVDNIDDMFKQASAFYNGGGGSLRCWDPDQPTETTLLLMQDVRYVACGFDAFNDFFFPWGRVTLSLNEVLLSAAAANYNSSSPSSCLEPGHACSFDLGSLVIEGLDCSLAPDCAALNRRPCETGLRHPPPRAETRCN